MNTHFKNILIMASAAIPGIGGPLSVFLDKYLPENLEKRKINFITTLIQDFETYSHYIKKDLINSDEFINTFLVILEKAIKESRKEKIVAFRNILLNKAHQQNKFDEESLFIRLIDEFNIDQIKILNYFYHNELSGSCDFRKENSIQKELLQIWPDIDYDYLLVCTSELIRYRIIVSSKKDLPKNKQSVFSSFGKKFVEYIFNPIEIKEF